MVDIQRDDNCTFVMRASWFSAVITLALFEDVFNSIS